MPLLRDFSINKPQTISFTKILMRLPAKMFRKNNEYIFFYLCGLKLSNVCMNWNDFVLIILSLNQTKITDDQKSLSSKN